MLVAGRQEDLLPGQLHTVQKLHAVQTYTVAALPLSLPVLSFRIANTCEDSLFRACPVLHLIMKVYCQS